MLGSLGLPMNGFESPSPVLQYTKPKDGPRELTHDPFAKLDSFIPLIRQLPRYTWQVIGNVTAAPQLTVNGPLQDHELEMMRLCAARTKELLYDGPFPDVMDVPLGSLNGVVYFLCLQGWRPLFPEIVHLKCATDDLELMRLMMKLPGDRLEVLHLYARGFPIPDALLSLFRRSPSLRTLRIVGQTVERPLVPTSPMSRESMFRQILAAEQSSILASLQSLPALRHLSLVGHTLTPKEWGFLSTLSLETLEVMTGTPRSAIFLSMIYPEGFYHLKTFRLHVQELDEGSRSALRSIRSPALSELHLTFTKCPSLGELYQHLNHLTFAPFAQELRTLQFYLSTLHVPSHCTRKCDYIDIFALAPLLLLPSLQFLKLECNHLRLTSDFLLELALALPNIGTLFLRQRRATPDSVCARITDVQTLQPFACYCPRLSTLGLDLDLNVDEVPAPPHTIQQRQLRSLEIGQAILQQNHEPCKDPVLANEVVRYVKALFPNIAWFGHAPQHMPDLAEEHYDLGPTVCEVI